MLLKGSRMTAQNLNVFILDDDPNRVSWFRRALIGYHIDFAANVADSLLMLRNCEYDIIFLDHDLGGPFTPGDDGDGIDVAKVMVAEMLQRNAVIFVHSCNPIGTNDIVSTLKETHPDIIAIAYPYLKGNVLSKLLDEIHAEKKNI
jgi:DNA-binding LytR/AlgR family response regulator